MISVSIILHLQPVVELVYPLSHMKMQSLFHVENTSKMLTIDWWLSTVYFADGSKILIYCVSYKGCDLTLDCNILKLNMWEMSSLQTHTRLNTQELTQLLEFCLNATLHVIECWDRLLELQWISRCHGKFDLPGLWHRAIFSRDRGIPK